MQSQHLKLIVVASGYHSIFIALIQALNSVGVLSNLRTMQDTLCACTTDESETSCCDNVCSEVGG